MVKQILSLPQNAPDTVPYIISGLKPTEGQIHIKALTFLYSIRLLGTDHLTSRGGGLWFFPPKILIPNVAEKIF
jgi:hypothetical protein